MHMDFIRGVVACHDETPSLCLFDGARGRNRTGTPLTEARDFKSLVSTNFTTRAVSLCPWILRQTPLGLGQVMTYFRYFFVYIDTGNF